MNNAQESSDLSWIDVQFLKTALETLVSARLIVKWTYVFAFFLRKNHHSEMFEDNQQNLEFAVEKLSKVLEGDLETADMKETLIDCNVYVSKRLDSYTYNFNFVRLDVMLDDARNGLRDERYAFI